MQSILIKKSCASEVLCLKKCFSIDWIKVLKSSRIYLSTCIIICLKISKLWGQIQWNLAESFLEWLLQKYNKEFWLTKNNHAETFTCPCPIIVHQYEQRSWIFVPLTIIPCVSLHCQQLSSIKLLSNLNKTCLWYFLWWTPGWFETRAQY